MANAEFISFPKEAYFIYFHFTVCLVFLYLQSWVYYPKEQVVTILMCVLFSISILRFLKSSA